MNLVLTTGGVLLGLGLSVLVCPAAQSKRTLKTHEVVVDQELLITAQEVVDSPLAQYPGPWSFGHLMNEAFGEEKAPELVAKWLTEWSQGKRANGNPPRGGLGGFGVQPAEPGDLVDRPGIRKRLIRTWQEADGFDPTTGKDWRPNFENAPFQLLGIVNRMDLSVPLLAFDDPTDIPFPSGPAYYSSGSGDSSGGEGRLIFAVTDQKGVPLEPGTTIILEYGLDIARKQDQFLDWATAWHELGTYKTYGPDYRAALAKVTRLFTDRRDNTRNNKLQAEDFEKMPLLERIRSRPTRVSSQLLRVRINDGAFGEIREFREFAWSESGFAAAPLAGTPREIFFRRGTSENRWMARWVRNQLSEKQTQSTARDDLGNKMPNNFVLPGSTTLRNKKIPVVAHVAPVPENNVAYHWDGWGLKGDDLRRAFSKQTCCGCHCGDTNTAFFHLAPRKTGEATVLSKYLRTDGTRWRPVDPDSKRSYLSAEMDFRKELFEAALTPNLRPSQLEEIREKRRGRKAGH